MRRALVPQEEGDQQLDTHTHGIACFGYQATGYLVSSSTLSLVTEGVWWTHPHFLLQGRGQLSTHRLPEVTRSVPL